MKIQNKKEALSKIKEFKKEFSKLKEKFSKLQETLDQIDLEQTLQKL